MSIMEIGEMKIPYREDCTNSKLLSIIIDISNVTVRGVIPKRLRGLRESDKIVEGVWYQGRPPKDFERQTRRTIYASVLTSLASRKKYARCG